jgi:hypothetical protein
MLWSFALDYPNKRSCCRPTQTVSYGLLFENLDSCDSYFMNAWIIELLAFLSVTVFALVGWWRGRGFRISYREGNSIMGFEGPLPLLFPLFFL